MTRIIGKPPAPKGGATFGDVPIARDKRDMRALFINDAGVILQRCGKRVARFFGLEEAYMLNQPVTLLDITPRDPEPDPAVTTYGELEPGEWFVFVTDHAFGPGKVTESPMAMRTQKGHAFVDGESHSSTGLEFHRVRRTAASVVVHEEPVTHVWADDADPSRVAILEPEKGRMSYGRAEAEAIARQITAWLAQEPASPDSDEPMVDGGDGEGYCPVCDTGQEGYPCLHPVSEVAAVKMAEPAEDRSKPAPGWEAPQQRSPDEPRWYGRGPSRGPSRHLCGPFMSRDEYIAHSWAQHDAQQAGKGGE